MDNSRWFAEGFDWTGDDGGEQRLRQINTLGTEAERRTTKAVAVHRKVPKQGRLNRTGMWLSLDKAEPVPYEVGGVPQRI